jgi:hypothetical protein
MYLYNTYNQYFQYIIICLIGFVSAFKMCQWKGYCLFSHYYRLVAFVCDGDGYVKIDGTMWEKFFRKHFNLVNGKVEACLSTWKVFHWISLVFFLLMDLCRVWLIADVLEPICWTVVSDIRFLSVSCWNLFKVLGYWLGMHDGLDWLWCWSSLTFALFFSVKWQWEFLRR